MHDMWRRFVRRRSTQRDLEPFLVRIRHRQTENAMLVPMYGQGVDQRLNCIGIIGDQDPGSCIAGLGN